MFENVWRRLRRLEDAPSLCPGDGAHDPLSHPAIRRMSPTELADLPMPKRVAEPRREHASSQTC